MLAAANEIDDLDFVALVDHRRIVGCLLHHGEIELDGDTPGVDFQLRQQRDILKKTLGIVSTT